MPKIVRARPVLLSAPYAHSDPEANLETRLHIPSGLRTTGIIEITLDNGMTGLGEGYVAVFAPHVFTSVADLLIPYLLGRDPEDSDLLYDQLLTATGYWSLQGAAQHVIGAVDIALQDLRAQLLGVPLWRALGGSAYRPLPVYASGGDSITPHWMRNELEQIAALGINSFKIRARRHQLDKVLWCQREANTLGIGIAIDMTQNLVIPSQTVDDVLDFLRELEIKGNCTVDFMEEVLGPDAIHLLPELRRKSPVLITGGEIVTTATELCARVRAGYYGAVQPDATVIGGVRPLGEVFGAARENGTLVYVHCWGGPVGMLANFHAALAHGGQKVEWPMPHYPLREAMMVKPLKIEKGLLHLPEVPGLGARLTQEIEKEYPFREEAVYRCLVDPARIPVASWK